MTAPGMSGADRIRRVRVAVRHPSTAIMGGGARGGPEGSGPST